MEEATMSQRIIARKAPLQKVTATIQLSGQTFSFHLLARSLQLGPGTRVRYFWMDTSAFRIARTRRWRDPANFGNCVGHWWAAMRSMDCHWEVDQIRHLLLAASYALLSRSNALQSIYRDAYLAPDATVPEELSLPDQMRERIKSVVRSRDREQVRAEFDDLLGGPGLGANASEVMRQTFSGILAHGVDLVRERGEDGLEEFVQKLDGWATKNRKKGNRHWQRSFLNRFAYECKWAFYTCFANVWIDLIPWLRAYQGLDAVSERFLRFWHMQNQPIEDRGGRLMPDVFCGQVLSLHPLSGFFMQDPALRAVAGRFFASDRYAEILANGLPEYWDVVGAILTAVHLYRRGADEQAQARGVRSRGGDVVDTIAAANGNNSHAQLLEDFAVDQKVSCPNPECHRPLHFVRAYPAGDNAEVRVDYACPDCNQAIKAIFPSKALVAWLTPAD
jgi:hypothetical protein